MIIVMDCRISDLNEVPDCNVEFIIYPHTQSSSAERVNV